MYQHYASIDGRIIETEDLIDNGLITVIDPSDIELRDLSERFNIDIQKLSAATDLEEPSRWEKDDTGTYLIVDVPYKNEEGNFDTTPLMIVRKEKVTLAICEKATGIVGRVINRSAKTIDLSKKLEFEFILLHTLTKEYQQDLKEIDLKRREVEKRIKSNSADDDVSLLHDLENSLVYFITSLKGCNAILQLIKNDQDSLIDKDLKNMLKVVRIENQQAIEMATVYKEILGSTRELLSTEINLRLNITMKILAIFTMMLTVPMVVTGAYGMNVDLPFQNSTYAFAGIAAGTMIITGVLGILLKKKRFV